LAWLLSIDGDRRHIRYCDRYVRQDYDFKNPRFERGYTDQIPLTIKPYPMKKRNIQTMMQNSQIWIATDEVFFKIPGFSRGFTNQIPLTIKPYPIIQPNYAL